MCVLKCSAVKAGGALSWKELCFVHTALLFSSWDEPGAFALGRALKCWRDLGPVTMMDVSLHPQHELRLQKSP